jgi:hypothetical protein
MFLEKNKTNLADDIEPGTGRGTVLIYHERNIQEEPAMSIDCEPGTTLPAVLHQISDGYSPI